jgi:ketosteroid isomerase-like protein
MPVATTPLVERIARVIAGRVLSANADGDDPSAGEKVDEVWRFYADDAVSILKTMREPDEAAAAAGDAAVWERMIEAAIASGAR